MSQLNNIALTAESSKGLEHLSEDELKALLEDKGIKFRANARHKTLLNLLLQSETVTVEEETVEEETVEDETVEEETVEEETVEESNNIAFSDLTAIKSFPCSFLVKNSTNSALGFAELGGEGFFPACSEWKSVTFTNPNALALFAMNLTYLSELNGWTGEVGVFVKKVEG